MQLGFAMLEVGGVREAHRMTVLAKSPGTEVREGIRIRNLMDSVVTCLAFQLSVQFMNLTLVQDANGSESQLAESIIYIGALSEGTQAFFPTGRSVPPVQRHCTAEKALKVSSALRIVSGAMAERAHMLAAQLQAELLSFQLPI